VREESDARLVSWERGGVPKNEEAESAEVLEGSKGNNSNPSRREEEIESSGPMETTGN